MATLATNNPTIGDIAKGLDPDGSVAQTVEILNQTNEILTDATFIEGNLPTGHRTSIRTGLPQPTWRKLYGGVQPTKSTKAQVTDMLAGLEIVEPGPRTPVGTGPRRRYLPGSGPVDTRPPSR